MRRRAAAILALTALALVVGLLRLAGRQDPEVDQDELVPTSVEAAAPRAAVIEAPTEVAPDGDREALAPPKAQPAIPAAIAATEAPAGGGLTLRGTVRAREGSISCKVLLELEHECGTRRALSLSEWVPHAFLKYRFDRLEPGLWLVRARAEGHRALEELVELAPGAPERVLELVLSPDVAIAVRFVTSTGAQLVESLPAEAWHLASALRAVATRVPPPRELPFRPGGDECSRYERAVRAAHAEPRERELVDGTLHLKADPPLYVSALLSDAVLETQVLDPEREVIVFVIDPSALLDRSASVSLRPVSAAGGAPAPQAEGFLSSASGGRQRLEPCETDRLCSPILAPGAYTLNVSAPECGAQVVTLRLAAGEHRELGAFALAAWTVLGGRVLDASGAPIAASIRLRNESPSAREDTLVLGSHSENDGSFTTQLPPGRWLFEFTAGSVEPDPRLERGELGALRSYDSGRGPLESEVVELAATTSVRLCPRPGLEPLVEYEVRAGLVVLRRGVLRRLATTLRLVPGRYTLLVRDGLGRVLRDEPLIVGAEPIEVEIGE